MIFSCIVAIAGLYLGRSSFPMATDPCRDIGFGHAVAPANPFADLAGERFDVGSAPL
jgi:hypothetical protein